MIPLFYPILYASHDGQTYKIARRLSSRLKEQGHAAPLINLAEEMPSTSYLSLAEAVIIASPIRYGYHLPVVDAFIDENRIWLRGQKTVLISVNLTARKKDKNTAETNPYMRKWLEKHRISPDFPVVLAGRLTYSRYKWWEQRLIQLIMWITKGPTSLDTDIDYTPWEEIDTLAYNLLPSKIEEEAQIA